jgi:hypothetical protein
VITAQREALRTTHTYRPVLRRFINLQRGIRWNSRKEESIRKRTESEGVRCHGRAGQICSSTLIVMLLASSLSANAAQQSGRVQTGETPIASSSVTLYSAGSFQNAAPTILGKATTDATGFFSISFNPPSGLERVARSLFP